MSFFVRIFDGVMNKVAQRATNKEEQEQERREEELKRREEERKLFVAECKRRHQKTQLLGVERDECLKMGKFTPIGMSDLEPHPDETYTSHVPSGAQVLLVLGGFTRSSQFVNWYQTKLGTGTVLDEEKLVDEWCRQVEGNASKRVTFFSLLKVRTLF